MSHSMVSCPACKKLLRSDRPVPEGATLRCPECKAGFSAPPPPLPEAEPVRLFGSAFYIAVAVSLILGGSIITAAFLLSGPRPPAEKADKADKGDKDDAALKLAADRKKIDDARLELEEQKKRLDLGKWLVQGESALAAGKHEEADKAFGEAFKLAPTDPAVAKGLGQARAGMEAGKKTAEDASKRDAERDRLLAEGRKALADKQYLQAVRAFEAARAVAPADMAVLAALNEARTALEADDVQRKKQGEYNARLAAGKTALEAGKYTDAVREYAAALDLVPDSADAKDGRKQAEAKLAALGEKEKADLALEAALRRARKSIDAKRYNEAIAELEGALRAVPGDREALRLLKTTKETLEKVKSSNAKLVAAAGVAATNGQMDEAARLAKQAVAAWAEDEGAKKALRNAERFVETGKANQEAYIRYLQAGALAMSTASYADAVLAYTEALKLNPGNDELARQLRNARLALENYQRNRLEYERLIRVGVLALGRNSFSEALKAFRAAEKLLPDDLAARDGVSRAKYGQAMAEGQVALAKKMKAQAITAFEAALAERPGDAQALLGLQRARLLR